MAQPFPTPGGSFPFLVWWVGNPLGRTQLQKEKATHSKPTTRRHMVMFSAITHLSHPPSLSPCRPCVPLFLGWGWTSAQGCPKVWVGEVGMLDVSLASPHQPPQDYFSHKDSPCYTRYRQWLYNEKVLRDRAGRGLESRTLGKLSPHSLTTGDP